MFTPSNVMRFCFIIVITTQTTRSYRIYQRYIPNGDIVPDPCNSSQSEWAGVGHQTKAGTMARNPFGKDFAAHNHAWTTNLCRLDSDGDGVSNGGELGDPDCTWTVGTKTRGPAISHPGVCEPLGNPACVARNSWMDCNKVNNTDKRNCTSIESNANSSTLDLRLADSVVPAKETTYYCQLFDLNLTSDLHMIATHPLIKANEVVHHILMFGCDPRIATDADLRSPYPCVMVPHDGCRSLIGAWTVGSPGECAHPEMGFKVGPRGYRTVAIQVHWNNPQHISGISDNSGLRIYLTSSLRHNDAGMLVIGQQFLQIEPNLGLYSGPAGDMSFSATCPERCTKVMFKTAIYVTSAVNHMHYLGKSQEIKVYRNNAVINVITDQHNYDYDDPLIHTFADPIQVNPGDEIRTTCVFNRTRGPNPVCWGEATSDEMCFGFITYYPLQSLSHPWCTSMKTFPSCDRHLPALSKQPFAGCRWWEFRNSSHPESTKILGQVLHTCYPDKTQPLNCTETCQEVAREVADHPCMQIDTGSYMIDKLKNEGQAAHQFLDAVVTCSCRSFSYCDRKTTHGLLGSRQEEFCTSIANTMWPLVWSCLWMFMIVVLTSS